MTVDTSGILDVEEIVKVVSSDGPRYGSEDCSRQVYRVGDLVIKVPDEYAECSSRREYEKYKVLSSMLAENDTYEGITFALPWMTMVELPDSTEVILAECIIKDSEQCGCSWIFGWQEQECEDPRCILKVDRVAKSELGVSDMHNHNWIPRHGKVYMVDVED